VPVPTVDFADRTRQLCDADYFFMPNTIRDKAFGPLAGPGEASWRTAFTGIVESVLQDGERRSVELGWYSIDRRDHRSRTRLLRRPADGRLPQRPRTARRVQ
jgi:hypothetical protein